MPDEVPINLASLNYPHRTTIQAKKLNDQHVVIPIEVVNGGDDWFKPQKDELWTQSDVSLVLKLTTGPERSKYIQITSFSDYEPL